MGNADMVLKARRILFEFVIDPTNAAKATSARDILAGLDRSSPELDGDMDAMALRCRACERLCYLASLPAKELADDVLAFAQCIEYFGSSAFLDDWAGGKPSELDDVRGRDGFLRSSLVRYRSFAAQPQVEAVREETLVLGLNLKEFAERSLRSVLQIH
jgi:hypothetical protein